MVDKPLVSVIIPAYNAQQYIKSAIVSVLEQNYPNIEVIVVDDGSTDGTRKELSRYRNITVVVQGNQGAAAARNKGMSQARGLLVGFIDADDVWPKDHISSMVPYLEQGSEYDFVRGQVCYVRDLGTHQEVLDEPIFLEAVMGACLYRKSVFDKVGFFDEQMRQGEDFDWTFRLRESDCKEKRINIVGLYYRRHQNNATNKREYLAMGQFRSIRKKLARMKSGITLK